jgi:hypothetical protein
MAMVMGMSDPYNANAFVISVVEMLVGEGADLETARAAFEATPGDFAARFAAATQASAARYVRPEVFIELPKDPAALRKADLEALVRPVAVGFLRSYPTKDELLDQVSQIEYRQQRRPAWVPRVDLDGRPLNAPETDSAEYEREPDRPVVVSALAELGDVTISLPEAGEDRPELDMAAGGIGEWESVLHTVLGLAGPRTPESTIVLDADANMALVPEEARWWPPEPGRPLSAHEDPGVASELLATSLTLGGVEVADSAPGTLDAVAGALVGAGDWRYSPRWLLESWGPGDNAATFVSARAAIAGWAHEDRSGVIVYVYGGSLHEEDGQSGFPVPLHSYLLAAARASDGTDAVEAVHRVVLSCPGEGWCHRGGCPDTDFSEADGLLGRITTAGDAFSAVFGGSGSAAELYRTLYGDAGQPEYAERVLEYVMQLLMSAGWVELGQSTWEGGLEEALLRRGEHCVTALYDPVTRQTRLLDGEPDLELMLQLLGDDGVLVERDGQETVDFKGVAAEQWEADLLIAAEDLLRGRIKEMPESVLPVQATALGLHPHADGTLRGPEAVTIVDRQLGVLLRTAGLIPPRD